MRIYEVKMNSHRYIIVAGSPIAARKLAHGGEGVPPQSEAILAVIGIYTGYEGAPFIVMKEEAK